MTVRDFFTRNDMIYFLDENNREMILASLKHIEQEPQSFVYASVRAAIDNNATGKAFILGILIGFAASDPRVRFKSEEN